MEYAAEKSIIIQLATQISHAEYTYGSFKVCFHLVSVFEIYIYTNQF